MSVTVGPNESIDSAYRRFVREMIVNGTFKELEKIRFYVGKGKIKSDIRRKFYKTKRKRAAARRSSKNNY
jgi:ribosomal protein S21